MLNESGEFGSEEFQKMMRGELFRFAQRQTTFALQESENKEIRSVREKERARAELLNVCLCRVV